ncbi:transposase [Streptococcus thermophilus]|nr:transposase [Streptococcus thermophilus]MCE2264607.1 transposase [Streptococcus thermophilus]MCE2325354.1 transposase [Streptococcus thermophilus]MCE2328563.1 transposase [Streptococcus thermophilus]MCE2333156.1 transposase [Streptococcus thermophilus]
MCSHYLAEIEPDVKAFQSDADLASWAGLCPESYESADIKKILTHHTRKSIYQAGFDHVGID